MEEVSEDIVRSLLVLGKSNEISEELQQLYPDKHRGLSARSVRRYISDHNLKVISKRDKEVAVEEAVREVSDLSVRS